MPQTLHKRALKWYHFYLQHPGGDGLAYTVTTICRWSGIIEQARKLCRTCKYCQKFKRCNAKYVLLPAKDAETLMPWHAVCVELIGTYIILTIVRQHDDKIITKELQLLFITFIDPATVWFGIAEVPIIDQYSARISQIAVKIS